MARNGSGTFSLVSGNPVTTGSTISSTWANNTLSDIATALTGSIAADGQTTITANLPMSNYKHTGAGSASASGQYLVYGQSNASLGTTSFIGVVQFTAAVNNSATQTMVGAAANVAAEVDVASAGTTDIGGAASNQIRITGTTTITSFGTTYTGPRYIRFAGALTLTHNGTSLILPSAANITTAAGDTCIALPLPSSAGWYVINYQKASGAAIVSSSTSGALTATYNYTCQTQALTSISNATPAVFTVTSTAHLPETGSPVQFTTSGGLPTGLSLATTYYVTNPSGSTFNVCTTLADAMAGTNKVATSSAGSGTHTMNSVYVKGSETFVIVEAWGGGGGGGGVNATSSCGAGGGAGGYSRKKILASALGATETITIGAGGTAGANTGGTGGTGGTTSFGSHISCTGGAGGVGNSTAAAPVGGDGGIGSSGDFNLQGEAGFNCPGPVDAARMTAGAGGCTTLGGAGKGSAGSVGTAAGNSGKNNSGSGGSGAVGATANIGGLGGSGRVIVYVYS